MLVLSALPVALAVLAVSRSAAAVGRRSPRSADDSSLGVHHCANHQPHTLDRYPVGGPAAGCGTVVRRGVTETERDDIVSAHNVIRRAVRDGHYADQNLPAASALPELRWDAELALVAQRWADQCRGGHDQCRDVARFPVGQNFAFVWSGGRQNWTAEALRQWFADELPLFRQADLEFRGGQDPVSGGYTGHLTQLLWAHTRRVGCGFMAVADPVFCERRTYVCNYGPAGNVLFEPVYPTEASRDGPTEWEEGEV
ncbi:Venom allergen 5 [Amphibalanus amphitrite]|uniref:Venom allergen 5 n=1 Tax=Amphibalanus amphitrite TaxID=1232801 RepID=A0A6A4XB12_AMPAM|nr:venom allergen 5-like [Amphibalanus amphitrite]KAF0312398.1 Venom allergen 5 [Amphibalanus amphitrite]